ncbi:uncharacterized protein CCOS01_04974 [Colletotrichum costaricense]|uniref:Secreted protein n=1 Tax=Colletotrichum costaricense TaxID=1209916 RepID=A0AAI9Z3P9_9PEZI|nr:uncharacterized protein CCOS01_04974 [Colletotrichum costaricense]KAK1532991.1 hypothetical protein CCOS01_04974 [Colletotrichum costaricense]
MCAGAGAGACVCSCSVLLLRFLPRCLGRQEEGKVRKVRYEAEVLIKHTGVPALAAAAQRKSLYTHSLHTLYLSLHRPSLPSLPSRVHSLPAPLRSFPRLAFFFSSSLWAPSTLTSILPLPDEQGREGAVSVHPPSSRNGT